MYIYIYLKLNIYDNTRYIFSLPRITRYLNQQQIFFPHWHTRTSNKYMPALRPGWNNRALRT